MSCMYCGGEHSSMACDERDYPPATTISPRLARPRSTVEETAVCSACGHDRAASARMTHGVVVCVCGYRESSLSGRVEETETREPVGLEQKLNQLCLLREAIGAEKVADEDGFVAIELIRQARILQNDLAAALRTPERQHPERGCNFCGGQLVLIRGRYPGSDKREVCPTCLADRIDNAREVLRPSTYEAKQASAPTSEETRP